MPVLRYEDVEVGQALGPIEYRVDPELVLGHLEAVGQPVPAFLQDPAGGLFIDPGVYVRNYMRLLRKDYLVQGAIHARTQVQLQRPAPAGQVLRVTGRIAEKYIRRGRPYLVLESTTCDASGAVISQERNTLLLTLLER